METSKRIPAESSSNNFINCFRRTNQRDVVDDSDGDSSTSTWLQDYGTEWGVMLGYGVEPYHIIGIDD